MFPGLDDLPYKADPVQPLTTTGEKPDDLDHDLFVDDLSDLSKGWKV